MSENTSKTSMRKSLFVFREKRKHKARILMEEIHDKFYYFCIANGFHVTKETPRHHMYFAIAGILRDKIRVTDITDTYNYFIDEGSGALEYIAEKKIDPAADSGLYTFPIVLHDDSSKLFGLHVLCRNNGVPTSIDMTRQDLLFQAIAYNVSEDELSCYYDTHKEKNAFENYRRKILDGDNKKYIDLGKMEEKHIEEEKEECPPNTEEEEAGHVANIEENEDCSGEIAGELIYK